ncbi:MAG TPA: penicillin-binding protein 2 [Vicinamibacterales bacterium]
MIVPDDRSGLHARLTALQYGIAAAFAILAICFWVLQVLKHDEYRELAENNHQRTIPLRAPRGMMVDRNGRVLVQNREALNISLVREQTRDLDQSMRLLAAVTGVEERVVREAVERSRHLPRYQPIRILQDATMAQISAVAARRHELADVLLEPVPTRSYPEQELAAHLFGYVGEITDAQLARPEYEGLAPGALVGQAGLELTYNRLLMGRDGARLVTVNSVGREVKELARIEPTEGKRVQLTIDYDVQKAAHDGLKLSGYNGSAVMLDPRNGEVLAFASVPAFDPNAFAGGIDARTWQALLNDPLRPLQNRAIQGRYSPGSTFKIAVAVAGLEEGLITPEWRAFCPGGATFYGRYFKCHSGGPHGSIDLRHAIEKSCNVYFYTLGNMLGIDRLHKWATALGLGELSGIDLPHEIQGIMPSTEWKRQRTGERWYAGETISVAIGQGQVSVTPLSLAVMMMTVANGGTRYVPHLVRAVDEGDGWKPYPAPPPKSVVRMKQSTIDAVHDGLWMVVNAAGTGRRAQIAGRDVAGKTGTAQVISNQGRARAGRTDRDLRDHGFFVFFAPAKNPEVAGVVFAEHSEHGSSAAPIAKHMIATYFAKKEGKPLPVFTPPNAPPPAPREPSGTVADRSTPPGTPVARRGGN